MTANQTNIDGSQPPIDQPAGAHGAPSPERTPMDTTTWTTDTREGGQPSLTERQRGERHGDHRHHGHHHGHRHGPGGPGRHRGFGFGRHGGPGWDSHQRDGDPDADQPQGDGTSRRFMGFGPMHRHQREALAQAMARGFGPGDRGGERGWGGPRGPHGGRRGFGGPGGPAGRGGPWSGEDGPGRPRGERFFERGELRYVILDLINDQPRHGYDIIRALEEQFSGLYSPSPGSVYPTLQLLEDQGFVVSEPLDGKKIFRTTDEGRAELEKRGDALQAIRDRIGARPVFDAIGDIRPIVGELWDLGQTVMQAASRGSLGDPERIERLREAIRRARQEIDEILTVPTVARPTAKPEPKTDESVPPIM